ncbi:MAG: tRNA (N6-threonylcarbamoyladenosine(37)-N6)-methyltransferase TrmO [Desulfobacteraceae bacterium]|nr:tRNA (N6-threonylcarbamoyladenosine(37)-N6)-methyltransferase TrmO [Desulfobacteraceae bacterium]
MSNSVFKNSRLVRGKLLGAAVQIKPIGTVRREGEIAKLLILPQYGDGLKGVERLKSLQVLYWMHQLRDADRMRLLVHPQGDAGRPKQGVFGLRSPVRPNPVGSTVVELEKREGNTLYVKGLDALDGSPIIDLKGT